jgi:hypothetical protein
MTEYIRIVYMQSSSKTVSGNPLGAPAIGFVAACNQIHSGSVTTKKGKGGMDTQLAELFAKTDYLSVFLEVVLHITD